MDGEDFSTWLKRQLRRRDWNQADLVRRGFAQSTVSSWVRGRSKPEGELSDRLADVLGVDRDVVLHRAGIRLEESEESESVRNIVAKVRRVKWSAEREALIHDMLDRMLRFDREEE